MPESWRKMQINPGKMPMEEGENSNSSCCLDCCDCSHPAKKRRVVNNNTLRDAQKRQKTPFRAVKLGIFVQNAHENTSRNTTV